MKSLITSLAAFAVAVTFAGAEEAKPAEDEAKPKRIPEEVFKKLDTNSDNAVSLEEFKVGKKDPARAEENFKRRDKDADGKLSLEEFKNPPKKPS